MPQHYPDHKIIAMLCSGDKSRQRKVLRYLDEEWKPMAYQIVVKNGGGDESQAEGIYDEAIAELIQLLRKGKRYDPKKSKLSTYFYGILRNKWQNFRRGKPKEETRTEEDFSDMADKDQPSAEQRLISEEDKNALADAIAQLDEGCQQLILEFWFEGKTLKELGEKWEISGDAVKKRHQRCREKLREILENREE